MSKVGSYLIVLGSLILLGYVSYQILIASMPIILKIAIFLIVVGVFLVLYKQIKERQIEKKEQENYKDL